MSIPRPVLAALLSALTTLGPLGCDWVDATGEQSGSTPASIGIDSEITAAQTGDPTADPTIEPTTDFAAEPPSPTTDPSDVTDAPRFESGGEPQPLDQPAPLVLVERTTQDTLPPATDGTLRGWRWHEHDAEGDIDTCRGVDGFDPTLAASDLAAACTDSANCSLHVEEYEANALTHFRLRLPALRAPLATRFVLSNNDGARAIEHTLDICGLSVNEAPLANDDRYTVTSGTTLTIAGDASNALLANDLDDDDVRNRALRVDTDASGAPLYAARFALAEDGGFIYRPRTDLPLDAEGRREDSFVYTVSDGSHASVARATIVIEAPPIEPAPNRAPLQRSALPDIELVVSGSSDAAARIDLSRFFIDPDGDTLDFTLAEGSLPPGDRLTLDRDGVLSGRPIAADVGERRATLRVSDGRAAIERDFTLSITAPLVAPVPPPVNTPPRAEDIANHRVSGGFDYDVAVFFEDVDGDRLRFSAHGLPRGVEITPDGLIEGRSRGDNRGTWFIVVRAEDGRGGTVEDGFRLTIR